MSDKVELEGMKMVITLSELNLPTIEEYNNGVFIAKGTYTNEAVATAVLQSLDYEAIRTPILPRNTIYYSEGPATVNVFMEIPAHHRTVYYHEAVIEDIPYPSLIFGFSLTNKESRKVVHKVSIVAIEEQFCIDEETIIYCYPYTNVNSVNNKVCWGTQRLPDIERITQLTSIPELFFNTPNSDSYYPSSNSSNKTFRELLTEIKGEVFPGKYLKPTGKKLKEWIHQIVHESY